MPDAFGENSYLGKVVNINSAVSSRTGSGFATNTSGVSSPSYGGGDDGGRSMLEMKVNRLESDMVEVKASLKTLEGTVHSVDKNMGIALDKLNRISEDLSKKASTEHVDHKITQAKLTLICAVVPLIAAAVGVVKLIEYFSN